MPLAKASPWRCVTSRELNSQVPPGRRSLGYVRVQRELLQRSHIGVESFGFVSLHDDMLKIFVLGY